MIDFLRDNGGNEDDGDDRSKRFPFKEPIDPFADDPSRWESGKEEMRILATWREVVSKLNCFDAKHMNLLQSLGFGTFGEKRDGILEAMSEAVKMQEPLAWKDESVPGIFLRFILEIKNSSILQFCIDEFFNSIQEFSSTALKDVHACEVSIYKPLRYGFEVVIVTFGFNLKTESKIADHEDYRIALGMGNYEISLMGHVYFVEEDQDRDTTTERLMKVVGYSKLNSRYTSGYFTVYELSTGNEDSSETYTFIDIGAQIIDGTKCRVVQFVPTQNQ